MSGLEGELAGVADLIKVRALDHAAVPPAMRPTSIMSGYAQQDGTDSGRSASWNLVVVWRLANQLSSLLLMSPDVRNQLKGHQSCVGQDDASSSVQSPQWQFSISKLWPLLFMSSA